MADVPYNPMDSVNKGLPAVIVSAVAAVVAGWCNSHGISLDAGTVGACIAGGYGIVNGLFHWFQNHKNTTPKAQ